MKKKSIYATSGVIGLLILSSIFYWFELRPAQIRNFCSEDTIQKGKEHKWDIKTYDIAYSICINKKGLEK